MDLARQRMYRMEVITVWILKSTKCLKEQLNSASVKTSLKSLKEDFSTTSIMASMATISGNKQGVPCTEHLHELVLIKSNVSKNNITINIESIALI